MPILLPWGPPSPLYHEHLNAAPATALVTVTASATPHTKGAWATLTAALDFDVAYLAMTNNTAIFGAGTQRAVLFDIGIGSAGNEKVIVPNVMAGGAAARTTWTFPIFMPKGSRVAMRCQSNNASQTMLMRFPSYYPASPHIRPGTVCFTYGADTATSGGVGITTGTSSSTWGTPAEITASTTAPVRWIVPSFGVNTATVTATATVVYRLYVGAGGSEKPITGILASLLPSTSEAYDWYGQHIALPVDIPTGTRLSVAALGATTSVTEFACALHCYA